MDAAPKRTATLATARVAALAAFLNLSAFAATHSVDVVDFEFVPASLVIAPGDTVVWTASTPDHTVTADDGSFDSSSPNGGTLPPGSTFSHTFTSVGIARYYCRIHGRATSPVRSVPDDAMMGVIRIAEPGVNASPERPLNSSPAAGAAGISDSPLLAATAFSDPDTGDTHAGSQWLVRLSGGGASVLDTGEDPANLTSLRLSALQPDTAYEWQVRYRDDRGAWSAYSLPTQFTVASAFGTGTGLMGYYFAYDSRRDIITRQVAARLDPVLDFDWGLGKPHPSAPANNVFIYWEGMVLPQFSEEYRFRVKADGGVRVTVNGVPVIDDFFTATFPLYRGGTVVLEAGIPAVIRVQYFDSSGRASMHLRWSSLSQPLEVIPQTRLYPLP